MTYTHKESIPLWTNAHESVQLCKHVWKLAEYPSMSQQAACLWLWKTPSFTRSISLFVATLDCICYELEREQIIAETHQPKRRRQPLIESSYSDNASMPGNGGFDLMR
jgi:hypothetical protein